MDSRIIGYDENHHQLLIAVARSQSVSAQIRHTANTDHSTIASNQDQPFIRRS